MKVFGGMYFSDVVLQGPNFITQCRLFNEGLIQGVQVVVESYAVLIKKTGRDFCTIQNIERDLSALPTGMEAIIHIAGENLGVDFGQNLDEAGLYHQSRILGGALPWVKWNELAVFWGLNVALACHKQGRTPKNTGIYEGPIVVAHPGYCIAQYEEGLGYFPEPGSYLQARLNIAETILTMLYDDEIYQKVNFCLENVPPLVLSKYFPTEKTRHWGGQDFWAIGATPEQLEDLIRILQSFYAYHYELLLDLTHLIVWQNQMRQLQTPEWRQGTERALSELVQSFTDIMETLPICHFSGDPGPNALIDTHTDLTEPPNKEIKEQIRLKNVQIICLEMPWHKMTTYEEAKALIERFNAKYL